MLLGILDDGRVTDAKGRVVNFANTVIIMTSNLGAEMLLTMMQVGRCDTPPDGHSSRYSMAASAVMVSCLFGKQYRR